MNQWYILWKQIWLYHQIHGWIFKLKGKLTNVTLNISNPEQGTIKLNTLPDNITNSKWTGKYYTDYEMTATGIEQFADYVEWYMDGILKAIPGENGLDDQLGEQNRQQG